MIIDILGHTSYLMEANQLLLATKLQSNNSNARSSRASWAGILSSTASSKPPSNVSRDGALLKEPIPEGEQEKEDDLTQEATERYLKAGGRRDTIVPSSTGQLVDTSAKTSQ